MDVKVGVLTGSSTAKQRREVLQQCADGRLHIITGTHALIEDTVVFKNLGLAIIDEQHRFGVAQRAKMWAKEYHCATYSGDDSHTYSPHFGSDSLW